MTKSVKFSLMGLLSLLIGWFLVSLIAIPTLDHYIRISNVMNRFAYSEIVLTLFVSLAIWLFYIQWTLKKLSTIFLYLFYSVYFFLLFVALFTKATTYHSLTLELFDFLKLDLRTLLEAALNVSYFIPLGVLYGLKAKPWEFAWITLLTITGIETIQYVFYIGTFAISDILLNFMGCAIGYYLCQLIRPRFDKKRLI